MAAGKKYYVVWKGHKPGVYATWAECLKQVHGFADARFKGFPSKAEAEAAFKSEGGNKVGTSTASKSAKPIMNSVSVDAACSGVPGDMEYQGVYTATKEKLFHMGPYPDGTNNIGEFLAIVHALSWLHKNNDTRPIYSDSRTAMAWVRDKRCKTTMKRTKHNAVLFEMMERAEKWLQNYKYPNPILKWETEQWGENPADFGRK